MERKLYLKLMGLKRELNIIADNIMNLSSGNASRDIPLYRSMINDTLNNTIKNILDITNDENIKNVLEKINNNITNVNDTLIREQTTTNSITHIANYIRRNADEIKTLLNNIK
jgi:cob(I)alamin adenosyltransferase